MFLWKDVKPSLEPNLLHDFDPNLTQDLYAGNTLVLEVFSGKGVGHHIHHTIPYSCKRLLVCKTLQGCYCESADHAATLCLCEMYLTCHNCRSPLVGWITAQFIIWSVFLDDVIGTVQAITERVFVFNWLGKTRNQGKGSNSDEEERPHFLQ